MKVYLIGQKGQEKGKVDINAEDGVLVIDEQHAVYTNRYGVEYVLPRVGSYFKAGRYRLSFNPNRNPALIIFKWNTTSRTVQVVCEVWSVGDSAEAEVKGDRGQLLQLMEHLFCLSVPVGNYIPNPEEGEGDYILFANYDRM